MQFFDNIKRIFQGLRIPNRGNSFDSQPNEAIPNLNSFSFRQATGPDKVTETFRQFGGIVVESNADAPSGWCVGRISVGEERDPRLFAFDSADSFRQATIALTFSCGMMVFGSLEDK